MARVVLILVVLLALAVAAGLHASRGAAGAQTAIELSGNVEVRTASLAFNVGGKIVEVLVDEGETVRPGQPLARLDRRVFEAEVALAQARVRSQEAVVEKLERGYRPEEIAEAEARLAEAEAKLDDARLIYERLKRLLPSDAATQQEVDDARVAYDAARAARRAAEARLALLKAGYRKEDVAAAKAELAARRAELERARTLLDYSELKAPAEGTVLVRAREPGDVVLAHETVFEIELARPLWVRAFVEEPDLGAFRPGRTVWITCDAAPGERFEGRVGYVSPTAEFTPDRIETRELRPSLVYRTRIWIDPPDPRLRQGMPVTVILPLEGTGEEGGR